MSDKLNAASEARIQATIEAAKQLYLQHHTSLPTLDNPSPTRVHFLNRASKWKETNQYDFTFDGCKEDEDESDEKWWDRESEIMLKAHERAMRKLVTIEGGHIHGNGVMRTRCGNRGRIVVHRLLWVVQNMKPIPRDAALRQICQNNHCIAPKHCVAISIIKGAQCGVSGASKDDFRYASYLLERNSRQEGVHRIWSKTKNGVYGTVSWRGKMFYAHRLAYIVKVEEDVPEGMVVRHRCKQKQCIAADCLEVGTYAENSFDRIRDGTLLYGERSPCVKLTDASVHEIRMNLEGLSRVQLSRKYGVAYSTIGGIVINRSRIGPQQQHQKKRKRGRTDITGRDFKKELESIEKRCEKIAMDADDPFRNRCTEPHWLPCSKVRDNGGYSVMSVGGVGRFTHRAALEAHLERPLAKDEFARHMCARGTVRGCCNPAHLLSGTARQNVQDMDVHGTQPRKISDTQYDEIRKRVNQGGETLTSVAKDFNVSISTISVIASARQRRPNPSDAPFVPIENPIDDK